MQSTHKLRKIAAVAALSCVSMLSAAQSIQVSKESFQDAPTLSFAPAPGKSVPPRVIVAVAQPVAPVKFWEVRQDDLNLANAFTRWAKDAGYRVRWDARKNSMIEGPDQISGSFEDAISYVLAGPSISESAYPLEVCFYPNTPPLARVTRKGEQDKECK